MQLVAKASERVYKFQLLLSVTFSISMNHSSKMFRKIKLNIMMLVKLYDYLIANNSLARYVIGAL